MTIQRILKIAVLALLFAVAPAIFLFLSSLWTVLVKADDEHTEDALVILASDVWFAKDRQLRISNLSQNEYSYQDMRPVLVLADPGPPPKPPLVIRFPSCSDPEIIEDPNKFRLYSSTGYPFSLRRQDIADAGNLRFAEKLGVARLALLRSCLLATPFAGSCGRWLDSQSVRDDEIIPVLLKRQQLKLSDNGLCWPQSELVGPDTKGDQSSAD